MRLNNRLTTSFAFDGIEYDIDLAFDNVLDVFDVLQDKELREYEKAQINLALLLDEQEYNNPIELWNYIYENFIHKEVKPPIEYDLQGNPMPQHEEDEQEAYYDLVQDAEYIFSSFQQAYGMNLFKEQGKLHWFEFRALLNGLPSDTILQRIVQIRAWEPSKHDSAEYKESMKKLQKAYALHKDEEVD